MAETENGPRTLTGGQAVQTPYPAIACVDWLQVTFFGPKTHGEILAIMGLEDVEFTVMERAFYGYTEMVMQSNISILNNEERTEHHVQMTGQGCRFFEQASTKNWQALLLDLQALAEMEQAHFTRIDFALDHFDGAFTIPTIKRKVRRGELVSKFRSGQIRERYKFDSEHEGDSEVIGDGVEFGSPTSRLLIRMYDKKLEREAQGFEVLPDKWVRVELQLRKEYANEAVKDLVNMQFQVGKLAKSYLAEYIRFIVPSSDSNKRRWPIAPFWSQYMAGIMPLKLRLPAPDKTVHKSIMWINRQASPTLAMIEKAKGRGFLERWINDQLEDGGKRMKKKHKVMVAMHKEAIKQAKKRNAKKMNAMKKKMTALRQERGQKENAMLIRNEYTMKNGYKVQFEAYSVLDGGEQREKRARLKWDEYKRSWINGTQAHDDTKTEDHAISGRGNARQTD